MTRHAIWILGAVLTACTAPGATDVGSFRGTLLSEGADTAVHPALLWYSAESASTIAVAAPAVGGFPAAFDLTLSVPPPDSMVQTLRAYDDEGGEATVRMAVAWMTALHDLEQDPEWPNVAGGDPDHLVIYLPYGVGRDNPWATFFAGPLAPGYHLMRVTDPVRDGSWAEWDECYAANPELDCGDPRATWRPVDEALSVHLSDANDAAIAPPLPG